MVFLCCVCFQPEQTVEQTIELMGIWDAMTLMSCQSNVQPTRMEREVQTRLADRQAGRHIDRRTSLALRMIWRGAEKNHGERKREQHKEIKKITYGYLSKILQTTDEIVFHEWDFFYFEYNCVRNHRNNRSSITQRVTVSKITVQQIKICQWSKMYNELWPARTCFRPVKLLWSE